jgi:DNA-binding transcriptional LysR family regulator
MADFMGEGIDVAFRGGGDLPDSSLVARKLITTYLVLAASPAYLAARGMPQSVDELPEHDCIRAVRPGGGTTTWRLNGPQGPSQVDVSGPFSANTGQAHMKAAVAGLGICLAPVGSLAAQFRSGELVEVLPGVASAPGGLYVVYPSRRHVPRAVTAFVDMVAKRITQAIPSTQA